MNTIEKVKQWFIDRDLENGGRLDKQSLKLSEEFGELCAGYLKKNEQLTKDSIGDCAVVIVGLALLIKEDVRFVCQRGGFGIIPKYRAWQKTWEEMCKVKRIRFNDEENITTVFVVGKTSGSNAYLKDVELMQSTGLRDKNGKEVFVGDIVKMSKDVYSEPTYYEVVRHYGGAYRLESKQHGCELWLRHTDCEIVGNVYENRELLEELT